MTVNAVTLPADAVIFDLEDAVSLDDKETARVFARDHIRLMKGRGIHTIVRINSLATGLTTDDLDAIVVKGLDGVMLAKTETASEVAQLSKMLDKVEKNSALTRNCIEIIPLIESAKGVLNAFQIVSSSRRVVAAAFGAGDYCRDLGGDITSISREEIELLYARSSIVNSSRAAGVQAIDTPFLGLLTDREAFAKEVKLAVQLGFMGKQCIHPSQIDTVNSSFSPSPQEVDRSRRIVKAFEEAQARGLGAISFEGKMVDTMNYRQAKETLARAQAIEERTNANLRASHLNIREIFLRQ
jgi:citrate lyase subunit beta/citryl-CoA lyase